MTTRQVVFGLLAVGVLFFLAKRQLGRIAVGNTKASIWKVNFSNVEIRTQTEILSGADIPVTVQSVYGQITYKNQYLGTVQTLQPITIQPRKTTLLDVTSSISTSSLISILGLGNVIQLNELINWDFSKVKERLLERLKQISPSALRLKGTLKAEGINLDFDEPVYV